MGPLFGACALLLSGPGLLFRSWLGIEDWASRILLDPERYGTPVYREVTDYVLAVLGVCLVASWGLARRRRWSSGCGLAAAAGLLPLFPWFSMAGLVGLFALVFFGPPTHDGGHDFSRLRARESPWQWAVGLFITAFWIFVCGKLTLYARTLGLPAENLGRGFWIIFLAGEILVICVHEGGHALAAWAVGFRIQSIGLGCLIISSDALGKRHIRMDCKRSPWGGGFVGSVPGAQRSLRLNQILVIFAGPFASLNASLLLFWVFLQSPGSGGADHWRIAGYTSLLFLADFVGNLLPLGYTDGTLLLHLILGTRKGREFSSAWLSGKDQEAADRSHASADFKNEAALRQRIVDQTLEHGERPSAELAHKYQALALAQLNAQQVPQAEQNALRSLEVFAAAGVTDAARQVNSWIVLHKAYLGRGRIEEAAKTREIVRQTLASPRKHLPKAAQVQNHCVLAQMYTDAGAYLEALPEIEKALQGTSTVPERLRHRAQVLGERAECEFHIGSHDVALEAVSEAAGILRSDGMKGSPRIAAASDMAGLAMVAWNARRASLALSLLSEAIAMLDQQNAIDRAARFRYLASVVLARNGRYIEAEAVLPTEEGLPAFEWHLVLRARAEVRLQTGCIADAVTDAEQAAHLARESPCSTPEILAGAESLLAEALQYAGRLDEAETQAKRALDSWREAGSADSAGVLITLALVDRARGLDSANDLAARALPTLLKNRKLKLGDKAYFLESEAKRFETFHWIEQAERFGEAAEAEWAKIGMGQPRGAGVPEPVAVESVTLE